MAFQVSTRDVSVSRSTSDPSDLTGKRPFPGTKATGQWATINRTLNTEYYSPSLVIYVLTIKIEVRQAELVESLVELSFNKLGLMRRVPELGGDEELFPRDD
jgi:hypothetical protein